MTHEEFDGIKSTLLRMEDKNHISTRFKEVLLNGKWIANTNYKDLLSSITWEQATMKIGSLNTIAALTFHINYYIAGVLNVFKGGKLKIQDKYGNYRRNIEAMIEHSYYHLGQISLIKKMIEHTEKR